MFLYEFAEKTAQKPDTVATYVRRNKKIFKNHVERRQKQIWLDEKAVDILLKKYPEVQKKQKKPLNKEKFSERPSKVWNIKKNGRYDFSGTANNICIYTNYKFTGKTGYKYYVKNTGKHSMVVKAKRLTKTYAKTTISAGDSATANFSDIKSSTEFYMTFEGSKFEGYIK